MTARKGVRRGCTTLRHGVALRGGVGTLGGVLAPAGVRTLGGALALGGVLALGGFGTLGCAQVLGIEETRLDPSADDANTDDDRDDDSADDDSANDDSADDDSADDDSADDDSADDADSGADDPEPEEAGPPEPGRDFSCIGTRAEDGSDEAQIEIVARIVDIATQLPLEGIKVTACRTRLDLECRGGTVSHSDVDGIARVAVANGFNGYLKVESELALGDAGAAPESEARVAYLWYFSEPLRDTFVFPIQSMTEGFRDGAFYGTSPVDRDPSRGEIAINVTDCSEPDPPTTTLADGEIVKSAPGVNAPDVHFELTDDAFADEDTVAFYLSNTLFAYPSNPSQQVTDASGLGGFLNVKPGSVPISAIPTRLGSASADDQLLVVAGFLTTLRLLPERR